MRVRIKWKSRFVPPGFTAWVIAPYIFFRTSRDDTSDRLFRHEMQHIYQVKEEGWLKFYVKYLWYSIRYGYKKNPYEVEARAREALALTPTERFYKDHG